MRLTDEEINKVKLTKDDEDELYQTATIGINTNDPDADKEFQSNYEQLLNHRHKEKISEVTWKQARQDTLREVLQPIRRILLSTETMGQKLISITDFIADNYPDEVKE